MQKKIKETIFKAEMSIWRPFGVSCRLLGVQRKKLLLIFMCNMLSSALFPVFSLMLTQQLLNSLQEEQQNTVRIFACIGIMSVFTFLTQISQEILSYFEEREAQDFEKTFHIQLLQKIDALPCSVLEESEYYDLIERTQYDANAGIFENIKNTFAFFSACLGSISYVVVLARYHIFLLGVVVLVPVVRYFYEKKYNLLAYEVMKRNTEKERKLSYYFHLLMDADAAKEIRMFQLSHFFRKRYTELKEYCNEQNLSITRRRLMISIVLESVENVIDFLCIIYIARETIMGRLKIGSFVLYSNSIDSAKQNLMSCFATRSILYKYAAMLEQIQKFLSLPEEQRSNNKKEMEQIRQIEFQHVYYRYPNQEKYVLQDINFTLQAGAVTVLMGYNGAGKSTLLKILMGIYTNYEGVILVNGKNQRTWDIEQYRKKVSVLFQNYIKYETSIAENIWYGNLHNDALKQQMPTVLEAYGLSELSMETNQELGYQFCNGRQISLGQWQKLAVARCLVHAGDIFVFDEPNASLDLVSEEIIFRQILSETREKICLFVLHRFNHFVISADQILVLNEGKIWEKGTHLQLMKRNDIYAKLYYAQNGKDHSALTF